jgi:hypothetical protein
MRNTPFAPVADPFLTPAECAHEIGTTDRFIRAEITRGRLKGARLSHKMVRIRRSWWDEYMKARLPQEVEA